MLRPQGTYFVMTDIRPLGADRRHASSASTCPHRAGVVAVPDEVFHDDPADGKPFVRFAFCKRDEVIDEAVRRLAAHAVTGRSRDRRDRIAALLARAPVFDGHNDLAWALRKQVAYDLDARDIAVHQPALHTDIPRLRAGGVGAQFFSVYVPGTLVGGAAVTATLEQIDCVAAIVARYPETFRAARTRRRRARGDRRRPDRRAARAPRAGTASTRSLGVLRMLRRLGVAYMTLTHNQNVPWADAATDAAGRRRAHRTSAGTWCWR